MTSADPVLRDFFHTRNFADISGPWRPGSIRDQLVRARMVVERAVAYRLISPDRPLAIAGAGIAGIAAAVIAHAHAVPVTIFEKDKPAAVQSQSFRWIDPAAYDWPHDWWGKGEFCWYGQGSSAQRLDAAEGHTIAFQFASLLQQHAGIRYVRDSVDRIERLDDAARVVTSVGETFVFSLALDCRGARPERKCGDFEMIPFWSTQDLRKLLARKAAELGRPPRVVISGGGDGAIQDFLLVATGEASIAHLAHTCGLARNVDRAGLRPMLGSRPDFAAFERQSLSLEERCWRDFCWTAPEASNATAGEAGQWYTGWADRLGLGDLPENPVRAEITLVRGTRHHSLCYPLNRLLAIVAERQFQPKVVLGRLEQIYTPADFDVALVRHGLETTPPDTVRRQSLPFGRGSGQDATHHVT